MLIGGDGLPSVHSLAVRGLSGARRWRRLEERRLGADRLTVLEPLAEEGETQMFTGIVTHAGEIAAAREIVGGREFVVASDLPLAEIALGASVAHSGVCLTVVATEGRTHTVQVSAETLARTTLASWREGQRLNLERSLRLGDELGGHLVFGHVDAVGEIARIAPEGDCHRLEIASPGAWRRCWRSRGRLRSTGFR